MKGTLRLIGLAWLTILLGTSTALAQFAPVVPDVDSARARVGPVYFNPSLSLTNVGVDTNLFNEADSLAPRRDVALTFVPQTELFMRLGRTWLTGSAREDLVWFREYRDQRSANGTFRGGWLVPLNRVTMHVEGTYVRSRERAGPEIDARANRRERGGTMLVEVRPWSRTFVGTRLERREIRYADDALFRGERLSEQLNRTRTSGLLSLRHELTPMTSLSLEVSAYQDRFLIAQERDADASQIAGGIRFDPSALMNGYVMVGYRRFSPGTLMVDEYRGPTLAASLSYVASSSTRIAVDAGRDVEYSYDPERPYYLMTGALATVTQRIAGPLDVQGRAGLRELAYRDRLDMVVPVANPNDRVRLLGGSIGYRVGLNARVALGLEMQRRTSPAPMRNFQGRRYGLSFTWVP